MGVALELAIGGAAGAVGARTARQLLALGYADVRILMGGLSGWVLAGLPLESKPLGH